MPSPPNVEPKPELLAVIQADREAARDWMLHNFPWSMDSRAARRQLEKAFARHRLDTRPTPAAVGGDELRAALKRFADALDEWGDEPEQQRRDIWEHPLSMLVGLDDFRRAKAALALSTAIDEARTKLIARLLSVASNFEMGGGFEGTISLMRAAAAALAQPQPSGGVDEVREDGPFVYAMKGCLERQAPAICGHLTADHIRTALREASTARALDQGGER